MAELGLSQCQSNREACYLCGTGGAVNDLQGSRRWWVGGGSHRKRQLPFGAEEKTDSAILSSLESHRNRMQLLEIEEASKLAQSEQMRLRFRLCNNSGDLFTLHRR